MAKYLGWISTTALTVVGLVMGILDVDFGPRWVWYALGIGCGFLAAFTFRSVWGSTDETAAPVPVKKVKQNPTMTAGDNATQIVNDGGGTFHIEQKKGK